MTGLFDRLGAAFVAPPSADAPPAHPSGRARDHDGSGRGIGAGRAPTLAVLCRPADALVVGGAATLLLASDARASGSLLAVWGAEATAVRAPAATSVRRLAATLAARGHAATASGRLVVVTLTGDLGQAAPEATRALAVASGVPAVVVLAGVRDERADDLLRSQDRTLVVAAADADPAVAGLVVAGLPTRAGVLVMPPVPGPARALAASGVAVVPPLRAALRSAMEAVA